LALKWRKQGDSEIKKVIRIKIKKGGRIEIEKQRRIKMEKNSGNEGKEKMD